MNDKKSFVLQSNQCFYFLLNENIGIERKFHRATDVFDEKSIYFKHLARTNLMGFRFLKPGSLILRATQSDSEQALYLCSNEELSKVLRGELEAVGYFHQAPLCISFDGEKYTVDVQLSPEELALEQTHNQTQVLNEQIDSVQELIAKEQEQNTVLQTKKESLEQQLKELQVKSQSLQEQTASSEIKLQEKTKELEALTKKMQAYEDELKAINHKYEQLCKSKKWMETQENIKKTYRNVDSVKETLLTYGLQADILEDAEELLRIANHYDAFDKQIKQLRELLEQISEKTKKLKSEIIPLIDKRERDRNIIRDEIQGG